MGDKQATDAGNENAVVRAVVGSSPNAGRLPADVKASMPSAVPTTEGMTGVDVTITDGRRKSGRLGRGKQRRLDKLADEGTGRRCEMIVAVAC
ncbi:hypothetical protein SprV_0301005200 [Sparganum proliferum]